MAQSTFFATFMGSMVREAFTTTDNGNVMGLSSKGIFLRVGNYVVFITDAPYKSPFNIYVPGFKRLMEALNQGEHFNLSPDSIRFLDSGTRILIDNVEMWTPSSPQRVVTGQRLRRQRASNLLDAITAIDSQKGWIFLHNLSDISVPVSDPLIHRIRINTGVFVESYSTADFKRCLGVAETLLGLGGGLTPSGDDWLAGFFLYLERFTRAGGRSNDFLRVLGDPLEQLAFQKTTTISANRIMAARRGWAEEPFLEVIDSLFTAEGEYHPDLPELLARFGHSSGVDTTLGIAAAVDCE